MDDDDAPLTQLELDLLNRLCESRVTLSAVLVAAEWWESPGDPDYSLVKWLIEGLGERGYVKYRLKGSLDDVPVYIRVTEAGYQAVGYTTHYIINVGEDRHRYFRREPSQRPLDATDFRNQPDTARHTPIERMPLEDHLREYPHHRTNKGRFFVCLTSTS